MTKFRFDEIARECRRTFAGDKAGVPIVGLEHITPREMLVRNYDIDVENTFTKAFSKGQILFGRRRAYQQKAAIATFDGICSGDITVIEPIPNTIEPSLLPFIVQSDKFFEHAIKGSAGSLSPRVKWEHLASFSLELPSLAEQKVLADKLWAAYNLKSKYEALIEATDQMVKSQFIEMFGELSNNKHDYPVVPLGELFEIGSSKRVFEKDWTTSGVPFYRAREIVKLAEDGYVNNELFITEEMYEEYSIKYGIPAPGDIMVTGVGTLGICYLVKPGDRFYYKDGNTLCFHSIGKVSSRYIVECFKLPMIRDQISANAHCTTVGTFTIDSARKTKVILPPIEDQDKFVTFVEQADKSKFELKKSIEQIDKVIKVLMQ